MEAKCPFKFLDPYSELDSDFFFGREHEVDVLYDSIQRNKLVVVYGPSGTGKTSLIRSGLNRKFSSRQWRPLYVRREKDINLSLTAMLNRELLEIEMEPEQSDSRNINNLSLYYLSPIYLVFEQFEELLLMGCEQEKATFFKSLRCFVESRTPAVSCQVIIVLREEFLGLFEKSEKELRGLTDRRLRIDPMQESDLKEVIRRTLNYPSFRISLESDEAVNLIYKALADKKDNVSLPYLQVYLDRLWREEFARSYPNGYSGEGFAPLNFTIKVIRDFGEIGDVLQKFLTEWKKALDSDINQRFSDLSDNFLNDVLSEFVSDYGTKQPLIFTLENGVYVFPPADNRIHFENMSATAVTYVINELCRGMILRREGKTLELSHDILARLIFSQTQGLQGKIIRIRVLIRFYKDQNQRIHSRFVREWEGYIKDCRLSPDELKFFEKSREAAEAEQHGKEIRKALIAKDAENKKRIGRRNKIIMLVTIASLVVVLFYYRQSLKREDQYFGMDLLGATDSMPDKTKALHVAAYVYNHISSPEKKYEARNRLLQIAQSPEFLKLNALLDLKLRSTAELQQGLDVDISASGQYLCVRNGPGSEKNETNTFFVLNTSAGKGIIDSFPNIVYSYFLSRSDTLLLAYSGKTAMGYKNQANSFILFDCGTGSRDTFTLKNTSAEAKSLYDRAEIGLATFSQSNSYRVARLSTGELVVPHLTVTRNGLRGLGYRNSLTLIRPNRPDSSFYILPFSLLVSEDNRRILYSTGDSSAARFRVYNANGRQADLGNIRGSALLTDKGRIAISTSTGVSFVALRTRDTTSFNFRPLHRMLNWEEGNYVIGETEQGGIRIIDIGHPGNEIQLNEKMIGYRYGSARVITMDGYAHTGDSVYTRFNQTSFDGKRIRTIQIPYTVEDFAWNRNTGRFLVMTGDGDKSTSRMLFLYNENLGLEGVFGITPNDTFGFSRDGSSFYIVRNDDLLAFKVGRYLDVTSLDAVLEKVKDDGEIIASFKRTNRFPSKKFLF
ncbi:MAG: ATP-binding protein [Chitinophagaceae bacterium]|nr:MAG: ATP-binding protein [Chitinophagaceae bacterium]